MKEEKKHKLLAILRKDFELAYLFSSHLEKNNLYMYPWSFRNGRYVEQISYTLSLIVSYSRPFSIPKYSDGVLPLCSYDSTEIGLHKKILDFRNEIYAHSDHRRYSFQYFTDTDFYNIEGIPMMRMERSENIALRKMMRKVMKNVKGEEVRLRRILYLKN
jgi:hypothetical protein